MLTNIQNKQAIGCQSQKCIQSVRKQFMKNSLQPVGTLLTSTQSFEKVKQFQQKAAQFYKDNRVYLFTISLSENFKLMFQMLLINAQVQIVLNQYYLRCHYMTHAILNATISAKLYLFIPKAKEVNF
ncbi:Hypothetical_protein [Hexamita inflata]|uniref:Hypothetical_protein n=1 Tax=Hexamita inflata TaxID=28002 RepID=A0AA86UVR8_9EUKA|nr:Hypothetical protein HINF_LOCUS57464 [Hexamita inflata]